MTAKYERDFVFLDPTRRWPKDALGEGIKRDEIVKADLTDIESADGMLVNMWRESIGASIGMVHAHRVGTPVVVADPNYLGSRMLAFYADGLKRHPCEAMAALSSFLGAGRWRVKKPVDGELEPFDRRRVVASIGDACRRAGKDDLVISRMVLPGAIERLKNLKIGNQITTNDINKAVEGELEYLRNEDDAPWNSVEGVIEQWNKGPDVEKRVPVTRRAADDSVATGLQMPADDRPDDYETASIKISSGEKEHRTIWGKRPIQGLADIPCKEARTFFQEIMRSRGVTEIHLGRFKPTPLSSRVSVCGIIRSLPQQHGLVGKFFNKYEKGKALKGVQKFRVHVQYEAEKDHVLAQCEKNLRAAGLWDERKADRAD